MKVQFIRIFAILTLQLLFTYTWKFLGVSQMCAKMSKFVENCRKIEKHVKFPWNFRIRRQFRMKHGILSFLVIRRLYPQPEAFPCVVQLLERPNHGIQIGACNLERGAYSFFGSMFLLFTRTRLKGTSKNYQGVFLIWKIFKNLYVTVQRFWTLYCSGRI